MKTFKKSVCLILSLIMLFSCCGAVLASAADYNHLPQIYVEGVDSKDIYYKNDPEKKSLFFPIDSEKLLGNLGNYKEYIRRSISNLDPDLLYNCLYSWIWDTYGMVALEKDGYTMSDEVTVDETPLNYKGNGKYIFTYDTRLDPVDIAHELDAYIKWVQEDSGSTRIELAGSSYGSAVVVAYLQQYPENIKNIDSVVLCVPSVNGVNFAGEIFSGDFTIDPDAVQAFVDKNVGNDDISLLLSVFNKTGTLDAILESFLEPVLKVALDRALRAVIHDVFGTFPMMWSFVDDNYFYAALENIYGEDYASPDHEYAVLIEKITYYHENVMIKADEILTNAQSEGVNVNIICKYGNAPFPLSKEGNFMGDGFVDLRMASFGATCVGNMVRLPEGYTQAKHTEYNMLSPDGCVDASTGLLPFTTWYIKGLNHGVKNDAYYELINAVLYNDLDVYSDPTYPQYLEVPAEDDEALIPMLGAEAEEEETSWLQDFLTLLPRLIKMLIEKIKEFFIK